MVNGVLTWARRHPAGKRALEALGQSAAHSEDAGKVPARPSEELDLSAGLVAVADAGKLLITFLEVVHESPATVFMEV